MAPEDQTVRPVQTAGQRKGDVERLHELGYAQELLRSMGGFSNFAVSFTIISILSGCLTLYGFGWLSSMTSASGGTSWAS